MNKLLRALGPRVLALLGTVLGVAASAAREDEEEEGRTLNEGSGVMGEHNLRTDRLDTGLDPYGWYEDDGEEPR